MITMREGIINKQESCIATIAENEVMQCTIALTQKDTKKEMTIEEEDNKSHPHVQDHLHHLIYICHQHHHLLDHQYNHLY